MRRVRSVLLAAALAATATTVLTAPALAGRLDDCHKPPPAWYTAPRFTHTYSQEWGAGYSRTSHDYSARRSYTSQVRYEPQRRSYTTHARYYRDPFGRW
jgi:hypothetical protein